MNVAVAVGPREDLLANEALGVVDQLDFEARELVPPVAGRERLEGMLGDRAGSHLRAEIPECHPRDAHVRLDQRMHLLDGLALGIEANPWHPQPFLEDLGVVARARPRQTPTDVPVMSRRHRPADQHVVVVDGLDDEDVLEVHAAVEGVVHDEDVARTDAVPVAADQRRHRGGDRAEVERDADRLRDRLAVRVAERR